MPKRFQRKLSDGGEKLMRTCDFSNTALDSTLSPYFLEQTIGSSDRDNDKESDMKVENNIRGTKEDMNTTEVEETYGMSRCLKSNDIPRESGASIEDSQISGKTLMSGRRLSQDFYDQDSITLAKALLGKLCLYSYIFFFQLCYYVHVPSFGQPASLQILFQKTDLSF